MWRATAAFRWCRCVRAGGQALEYLAKQDVELIVLDYYTPEMNGQEFLDRLHTMGRAPAVIMVTSASDTDIVRSLLSRGVQDYLVKPFEFVRFRQALDKFLQRQKLLSNSGGMDQRAIDQLLQSQDGEEAAPQLSKAQWGHPAPHPGFPSPQPGAGPHQRGDRRAGTPVPNHHPPLCQLHGGDGRAGQFH